MFFKLRRAKVLLVLYLLFLVGVIVAADIGIGQKWWRWLRQIPLGDKLGHLVLFGSLSFLVNWIWYARRWHWGSFTVLKGSAILFLVVLAEEVSQLGFRSRTFDLFDLLADAVGIFGCGWLAQQALRRRASPEERWFPRERTVR